MSFFKYKQVNGPPEKDNANKKLQSLSTFFEKHMDIDANQKFLSDPLPTVDQALKSMKPSELIVFDHFVMIPIDQILRIAEFPQKSKEWLWARQFRIPASKTGAAVGQQRLQKGCGRVLSSAFETTYGSFESNPATNWGQMKETYAAQCYVEDLNQIVSATYRKQRKTQGPTMKSFVFRGQTLPVLDINQDPIVEILHYNYLIDYHYPWRGISPDGVIQINGVCVGLFEAKCPYKFNQLGGRYHKDPYVFIKPYYYNQIMCQLHVAKMYWPTVKWVDFTVWTPDIFTVETFTLDNDYFQQWYLPRELKFYFRALLPIATERLEIVSKQESSDFKTVMHRELQFPLK